MNHPTINTRVVEVNILVPVFPSKEWAEKYCEALNNNERYNKAGKGWVWPILFVVEDLPDELKEKYPGKPGFLIKLENGKCLGVEWYDDATNVDAPYILGAKFSDWLDIIAGKMNPLTAIVRRKLKLLKGDYGTVMRYPIAALEMVKSAQQVPRD